MNQNRRSLLEAVASPKVPQEVLDIIKEGTPKPQTPLVQAPAATEPTLIGEKQPAAIVDVPKAARLPKARTESRPSAETVTFVSVNYRLPSHIPATLLKVSAERKVQKNYPSTQQEIVAVAVGEWLKKHGYLE